MGSGNAVLEDRDRVGKAVIRQPESVPIHYVSKIDCPNDPTTQRPDDATTEDEDEFEDEYDRPNRPATRSVWDVRERLQENFERVEAALRALEADDETRSRLAVAEEIRQHIALANKTLETAVRAEAVEAFQEVVLQALAEASATVRRKVIETLNARAGQVCAPENPN